MMASVNSIWKNHYEAIPQKIAQLKNVPGVLTAFNTNIDAVKCIDLNFLENELKKYFPTGIAQAAPAEIHTYADALRGLWQCFTQGSAAEWIIQNETVYQELKTKLGYDRLQMGGQAGIIANVLGMLSIPCYVHCAALPPSQAELFVEADCLTTANEAGNWEHPIQAFRKDDPELIHWILEFKTGDQINFQNQTWTCPKSNRFIATYDPYNFQIKIDAVFKKAMQTNRPKISHLIVSGFQMLSEKFANGLKGRDLIDQAWGEIKQWVSPKTQIHLEMASTQDRNILHYLATAIAPQCHSLGFNEQELMDLYETLNPGVVINRQQTQSHQLLPMLLKLRESLGVPRLQLHVFGLYITVLDKRSHTDPFSTRQGMLLAADVAATKAGIGLDPGVDILWGHAQEIQQHSFDELQRLYEFLNTLPGKNQILEQGIFEHEQWFLVAVPSKIILKPKSLVGMGDTISSLSLIGCVDRKFF
jgi:ADP-dependent phosphofructokinase/glucokinase